MLTPIYVAYGVTRPQGIRITIIKWEVEILDPWLGSGLRQFLFIFILTFPIYIYNKPSIYHSLNYRFFIHP